MKPFNSFHLLAPFIISLAMASACQKIGIAQSVDLATFTTHLDKRIPTLMKTYDIPGVIVAVVQKGSPVWSAAYGYAEVAAGRQMTTDTYCRVESISKSVTAWGVMKLVEQGKIELDAPATQYLKTWNFPPGPFHPEKITVRQLLSHTAGLALGTIGVRYDPQGDFPTLKEQLNKDAVLIQSPGQGFSYSNAGFNVLELLIEEVTGRDFAAYMQEEVLTPLGMDHASFNWSSSFDPPVPNGYDLAGNTIPVYIYPDRAAGGLFAPVDDIANFVTAGMTNFTDRGLNVLNQESIQTLYQPAIENPGLYTLAFDAYGFGHFIEWLPTGQKAVSHGGQGSGWMTHFHAVPQTGDGIVILTNSQRSWPFFAFVLNDWAAWCGFSSVGMGKIVQATMILKALVVSVWIFCLGLLWRLGQDLRAGKRRFAPLAGEAWISRLLQATFSVGMMAGLWWAASQPYLFFSSVFPVASVRLGLSVLILAAILLLRTLFPRKKTQV